MWLGWKVNSIDAHYYFKCGNEDALLTNLFITSTRGSYSALRCKKGRRNDKKCLFMIFIKISLQHFYCRTVQRTRLVRGAIVITRNNREWHFVFYCTAGTCDACCDERERLVGCCHWMSPLAEGLNHRSSFRAILLLFQQLLLFCCWPLFKYKIFSNEYFQSTFFFTVGFSRSSTAYVVSQTKI